MSLKEPLGAWTTAVGPHYLLGGNSLNETSSLRHNMGFPSFSLLPLINETKEHIVLSFSISYYVDACH